MSRYTWSLCSSHFPRLGVHHQLSWCLRLEQPTNHPAVHVTKRCSSLGPHHNAQRGFFAVVRVKRGVGENQQSLDSVGITLTLTSHSGPPPWHASCAPSRVDGVPQHLLFVRGLAWSLAYPPHAKAGFSSLHTISDPWETANEPEIANERAWKVTWSASPIRACLRGLTSCVKALQTTLLHWELRPPRVSRSLSPTLWGVLMQSISLSHLGERKRRTPLSASHYYWSILRERVCLSPPDSASAMVIWQRYALRGGVRPKSLFWKTEITEKCGTSTFAARKTLTNPPPPTTCFETGNHSPFLTSYCHQTCPMAGRADTEDGWGEPRADRISSRDGLDDWELFERTNSAVSSPSYLRNGSKYLLKGGKKTIHRPATSANWSQCLIRHPLNRPTGIDLVTVGPWEGRSLQSTPSNPLWGHIHTTRSYLSLSVHSATLRFPFGAHEIQWTNQTQSPPERVSMRGSFSILRWATNLLLDSLNSGASQLLGTCNYSWETKYFVTPPCAVLALELGICGLFLPFIDAVFRTPVDQRKGRQG